MNFKSAVLICALYFVTATQSVGINQKVLDMVVKFIAPYESVINHYKKADIVKFGIGLGVANMEELYQYEENKTEAHKVQRLLVILATNDKTSLKMTRLDSWNKKSFTSYELAIIVNVFNEHDKKGKCTDGLLSHEEVKNVINDFDLAENDRQEFIKELEKIDNEVNAAEFLQHFLKVKPDGNGVDKSQIEELIQIKDEKTNRVNISTCRIKEFYKKLSILKDYPEELNFTSNLKRTTHLELQELVVNSAEYAKNIKEGYVVFTKEVRDVLEDFDTSDKDHSGTLSETELEVFAGHKFPGKNVAALIERHDTNNDQEFDIVEIINAVIEVNKEKQ